MYERDQHMVYFVGGPMDLSKKAYQGEWPKDSVLHMRGVTPMSADDYNEALSRTMHMRDHSYRVIPLPRSYGTYRTFIAIYEPGSGF